MKGARSSPVLDDLGGDMKRIFFAALAIVVFSVSCSFDPKAANDPNQQRDQERHDKLTGILQSIRGTYTGKLVSDGGRRTEDAILRLNYYDRDSGRRNADGQKVYLPVPTGKFILPESDGLDSNLEGSYNEVTGAIALDPINTAQQNPNEPTPFSGTSYRVQGSLINGSFEGQLLLGASLVGTLSLPNFTPDVHTPRNEEQEQYDRRTCWLNRVVGQYLFDVKPYDRNFPPFQMNIAFNLEDSTDPSTGWVFPVLVARGRRTDGFSKTAKYRVIYKDDVTPEQISLIPLVGAAGYGDFTLTSRFVMNAKTGTATIDGEGSFPTFSAKVHADRDPKTMPPQADCRKRWGIN